jgi:hypothetical protein
MLSSARSAIASKLNLPDAERPVASFSAGTPEHKTVLHNRLMGLEFLASLSRTNEGDRGSNCAMDQLSLKIQLSGDRPFDEKTITIKVRESTD